MAVAGNTGEYQPAALDCPLKVTTWRRTPRRNPLAPGHPARAIPLCIGQSSADLSPLLQTDGQTASGFVVEQAPFD